MTSKKNATYNPRNASGINVGKTVTKADRYFAEENKQERTNEDGLRFKLGPLLYSRDYTMKGFAEAIGHNEKTVRDFVKGRIKRIPADFLAKACEELECGVSDLIDYPARS